ncbi:MAG: type II secretion system F family protein [Planctomycetota bacterium]|nr:type II secretion system F family protein [Planctomycetota bacterium]
MSPQAAETSEVIIVAASCFLGAFVALFAYSARPYYWRGIDFLEADFSDKLRRLQKPTRHLRVGLIVWSVSLLILFFSFTFIVRSLPFAILATLLLFCGPWWILRRKAQQRREQIEDQLADAMVSLSSAIRAGLSLPQAVEMLADTSPQPIKSEFGYIITDYEMGKPLDRALEEAKDRLRSENFALFAAALLASRDSGGRLNETVDRISHSVRELQRLERKVQSDTAMARKSAVYMALTPLFILVAYYFVDSTAVANIFVTTIGQLLLTTAIVLNIIAYFWARHILNPDI